MTPLLLALLSPAHGSALVHDGAELVPLQAAALDVAVDGRVATGAVHYTFDPLPGDGFQLVASLPESAAVVGLRARVDGAWVDAEASYLPQELPLPDGTPPDALLEGDLFAVALPWPTAEPLEIELEWQAVLAAEEGAVSLEIPLTDGGASPGAVVDWTVGVAGHQALDSFDASLGTAELLDGLGLASGTTPLAAAPPLALSWTEPPLLFGLELTAYRPLVDPFTGEGEPDGYALFTLVPGPPDQGARVDTLTTFLIDSSASMQGRPMRVATDAAESWLRQLQPDDRFNLVPYTSVAVPFRARSPFASEDAVDAAVAFLERQQPAGLSDPADGMVTALALLDDTVQQRSFFSCGGTTGTEGPPVREAPIHRVDGEEVVVAPYVVWITDGGATIGEVDPDAIVDAVVGANAVGASVFAVGVGNEVDLDLLERVTGATRGEVRVAERVGQVPEVVATLRDRIADPVLVRPTVSLPGSHAQAPAALPDGTSGTELVFALRYRDAGELALRLTGLRGQGVFDERIAVLLPSTATAHPEVARVWAQLRVADLDRRYLDGDTALYPEIEALVRQYGVASEVVSLGFVAPEQGTDAALSADYASSGAGCGCVTQRGLAGGVPLGWVGLLVLARRRLRRAR